MERPGAAQASRRGSGARRGGRRWGRRQMPPARGRSRCYSRRAVVFPSSVRCGRSLARLASPIFTASRSSRLLKPPLASRASISASRARRDAGQHLELLDGGGVHVHYAENCPAANTGAPSVTRRDGERHHGARNRDESMLEVSPGTGSGARRSGPSAIAHDGELGSGEQVALSTSIGKRGNRGARAARVILGAAHRVFDTAVPANHVDCR